MIYSQCECTTNKCTSNCLDIASFILFADDSNLFVNGRTVNEVFEKTNMILSKIKLYLEANFLHINVDKSKYELLWNNKANVQVETGIDHERYTNITSLGYTSGRAVNLLSQWKQLQIVKFLMQA